jgi:hypothetical protein
MYWKTHHLDSYFYDPADHTIGNSGHRFPPPLKRARREFFPSHGGGAAGYDTEALVGYEDIEPCPLEVAQGPLSELRCGVDSQGFDLCCDC